MKYINTAQLKSSIQTPIKILEESIQLDNNDLRNLTNDISLFLLDIEKLKDGLYCKKEEIIHEIQQKNPEQLLADFHDFEMQFADYDQHEKVSIKNILDEHKKISELKKEVRIITILQEIEKGNYDILEKMMHKKEEWVFLTYLYKTIIEESDDDDLTLLVKQKFKDLEEYILTNFQNALDEKNNEEMKRCYLPLKNIDKHHSLIRVYIKTLPMFMKNKKEKFEFVTVDLDYFENTHNSFIKYLECVEICFQEELNDLVRVFSDSNEIVDFIIRKLFDESLNEQIEYVIDEKDPVLFLLNLDYFFGKVQNICKIIQTVNPIFNEEKEMNNLFEIYLTETVFKEKELFDFLFEIIVRKKKSNVNYLIKGENIYNPNFKPIKEITLLANLISLFIKRSSVLEYTRNDFESVIKHIFKKLILFVDVCCNSFTGIDRFELIKVLSDVFLVIKNCFDCYKGFDEFKDYVQNKIQNLFDSKAKENEIHVKQIIKNVNFKSINEDNTNAMLNLITFLKREFQVINLNSKGRNGHNFIVKLMQYIYHRLYKYYIILHNKNDIIIVMNDIRLICKFVRENKIIDVYNEYEYLLEIVELISVRKEDIMLYYKAMAHKVPENELKGILKCRNDYKEIKSLFY